MSNWRPWLPVHCLVRGRTVAPFAAVVEGWVHHWFVDARFAIAAEWSASEGTRGGADWAAVRSIVPGLELQERGGACGAVADALIPSGRTSASAAFMDDELLELLGRAVLDDLLARLSLLGPDLGEGSVAGTPANRFHLALSDAAGRPILRLVAREDLLVFLARRGVAAVRPLLPPADPDEAISGLEVEASALAGRACLSYADLRDLAAGDVLTPPPSHEAPLDLLVDGAVAARALVASGSVAPPPSLPA